MISNQIIQTSLDELRAITKVDLCVYDLSGMVIASTMDRCDITGELITTFAHSPADSQVIGAHHLLKISDEGELLYVLVARGLGDDAYMVGKIAVCQIHNLAIAYKERFDRNNFFQNLLLDNLLLVDIYNRAKKLHIEATVPRVVYLIETHMEKDSIVTELLKGMFSNQAGDYSTSVDESSVILIKALDGDSSAENLESVAQTIVDMLNAEAMASVRVAYGTVVQELLPGEVQVTAKTTNIYIFDPLERSEIQSIEVTNEFGGYKVYRDASDAFQLEGCRPFCERYKSVGHEAVCLVFHP